MLSTQHRRSEHAAPAVTELHCGVPGNATVAHEQTLHGGHAQTTCAYRACVWLQKEGGGMQLQ